MIAATASAAIVTTFAGTGTKGFSGDRGPTTQAELNNVNAVARSIFVDSDGAVLIGDSENHHVRVWRK